MDISTACSVRVRKSPPGGNTYLIECKKVLFDFLPLRVIALSPEPKFHHPVSGTVYPNRGREITLESESVQSRKSVPMRTRETPFIPSSCSLKARADTLLRRVWMQFEHRASSQESPSEQPISAQENLTYLLVHAHNAQPKQGLDQFGRGFPLKSP